MFFADNKQADIIDAFKCLDVILNIKNIYFDNMVFQIYLSELQLNKVNTSEVRKKAKITNRYNQLPHLTREILFVCFDSLRPINILSVIKGWSSWVEPVLS